MKTKILKILRNADGFVSGQAICESLGVSRTAVWKVINQLKEEGYEFDAVSNKGYRIVNYPDILTKSEIESQLDKNDIIKKIVFFDETDSTNNRAKKAAEKRKKLGFSTGKRNLDDTSYTPGYKTGRGINAYDSCSYGCFVCNNKGYKI